jgi:hypothetical protein
MPLLLNDDFVAFAMRERIRMSCSDDPMKMEGRTFKALT